MASNVEIVRGGYEHFGATGELDVEIIAPDFVWDMSHFEGWPEEPTYEGVDGARTFLKTWTEGWDDWSLKLESLVDAGDLVVAIMRQSGRSKTTGLPVDMEFGMVWTLRDGKQAHMAMYADPGEAMRAADLTV